MRNYFYQSNKNTNKVECKNNNVSNFYFGTIAGDKMCSDNLAFVIENNPNIRF